MSAGRHATIRSLTLALEFGSGTSRRFQRPKIVPVLWVIRSPFENREHLLTDQPFRFGQLSHHGVIVSFP